MMQSGHVYVKCRPIGMTMGNSLAAAALCLDGKQMVFTECPTLPHAAPPKVNIFKMALWEQPPPWYGVQVPWSPYWIVKS